MQDLLNNNTKPTQRACTWDFCTLPAGVIWVWSSLFVDQRIYVLGTHLPTTMKHLDKSIIHIYSDFEDCALHVLPQNLNRWKKNTHEVLSIILSRHESESLLVRSQLRRISIMRAIKIRICRTIRFISDAWNVCLYDILIFNSLRYLIQLLIENNE